MQSKAVWFKKRRGRLSQLHYVLTWPCKPCCALQAQAGTDSGLTFPTVWGCSTSAAPLEWGDEPPTHRPHPLALAEPQQCSLHSGLLLGALVLSFYGLQAVIQHRFTCLWPFPGFRLCYVIVGFRNQCVCTSACLGRQRRVSSG